MAMKLGLALDENGKMADSSDVHLWDRFWSYGALNIDKIWET